MAISTLLTAHDLLMAHQAMQRALVRQLTPNALLPAAISCIHRLTRRYEWVCRREKKKVSAIPHQVLEWGWRVLLVPSTHEKFPVDLSLIRSLDKDFDDFESTDRYEIYDAEIQSLVSIANLMTAVGHAEKLKIVEKIAINSLGAARIEAELRAKTEEPSVILRRRTYRDELQFQWDLWALLSTQYQQSTLAQLHEECVAFRLEPTRDSGASG